MKSSALILCLAAGVAVAQTAAKPATTSTKPATHTAKPASASTAGAAAGVVKYPAGKKAEPEVKKTLFALRVQDIKIGTGAEAEPLKMYKVKYTGWRAADGVIFDSWDQHPTPVTGADGKPETDADGKPKTTAPQPASFPVGMGRMIPGFDQGFAGMRVGGVRRIFIPWQLAYGSRTMPDRDKDHPGIPSKSDLVFEVELVDLSDLPAPPHPVMPGASGGAMPPGHPAMPSTPSQPQTPPPSQPQTPPPSEQSTPPPSDKPSTPQSN